MNSISGSRPAGRVFFRVMLALVLAFPFFPLRAAGPQEAGVPSGSRVLVVYFSVPETDDPHGMTQEEENSTVVIDGKVLGNTQYVAQLIRDMTGGDLFRIEPVRPYPLDHRTLAAQARKERDGRARPAIAGDIAGLERYDTVFIGYPTWWYDLPMIMYSFLERYDLSGKTVIPFNTHGGSRFAGTVDTISRLQPGARVSENGLSISRDDVERAETDVREWLAEWGYRKK